ncbi:hypothetical protein OV079_27955 [Nannocystis pusilla]|uniref:Uncharacterized protein n=1 Tax=Nannocystis pusilla TaxID=889268 RepID=A0A9X3ESV8_9BACT|nr:hypothetical protein [Nannocystis pusilla]MCY1009331.1 hypothetical protein [Nannocystis pusilla]
MSPIALAMAREQLHGDADAGAAHRRHGQAKREQTEREQGASDGAEHVGGSLEL